MSLLIEEDELIEVCVHYEKRDNAFVFYEEEHKGAMTEKFYFKNPSWGDQTAIMEHAFGLDVSGMTMMNPYLFIDGKIKVLLKKWSLKMPVSDENIDKLQPALVNYLDDRLNKLIFLDTSVAEELEKAGKDEQEQLPDYKDHEAPADDCS